MHCLATEPNHTVLRVSVIDRDQEAAYDTLMLGALRPGYRCIELRSKSGTKIEVPVHARTGGIARPLFCSPPVSPAPSLSSQSPALAPSLLWQLCTLFVHIALSEANPTERLLAHKQSVIEEQVSMECGVRHAHGWLPSSWSSWSLMIANR